jgi:hypothetical protein
MYFKSSIIGDSNRPGDCGCARVIQNKTIGLWRFSVMNGPSDPVPYDPLASLLPDAGEALAALLH